MMGEGGGEFGRMPCRIALIISLRLTTFRFELYSKTIPAYVKSNFRLFNSVYYETGKRFGVG